jgi:hypothetical protein
MSQGDMIVSMAGLLGALVLVTSGGRCRAIKHGTRIRLALIWIVIFIALAWLAQVMGLHTAT